MVGKGELVGAVGFDGPYAVAHHELPSHSHAPPSWAKVGKLDYTVPGTGPGFISRPLFELHPSWLRDLAAHAFEDHGLERAMGRAVRDWKTHARRRVPRDTGELRDTATAQVWDNGRGTYRRRGG